MPYVLGVGLVILTFIFIKSLKASSSVKHLNSEEFKTNMKQGTILDVRTKNEFKQGHIKNSICIPVNTLMNKMDKINKDKPVYVYCASGARSSSAARYLFNNGFEVYNLRGGLSRYDGPLTRK